MESGDNHPEPQVKQEPEDDGETKGQAKFQVNMGLIPSASLTDDVDDLKALGLDVFNQEDLEQGVLKQVDQAIAKEEETKRKNALKKELKTLNDSIRSGKHDLASIATQLAQMGGGKAFSSSANRRVSSVQKQKDTKLNEMKKLEERKKKVQAMLDGKLPLIEDPEENLQNVLGSTGNADKDSMIRTGEMTPFGSVVPLHVHDKEKAETTNSADSRRSEKKTDAAHSSHTSIKTEIESNIRDNSPDLSDTDNRQQDNDNDWIPSDADQWGDSDFEEDVKKEEEDKKVVSDKQKKAKSKNWSKKFNRPIYRSDDESDSEKLPRAKAIRKYRDDGCEDFYEERMEKLRATDLRTQRLQDAGQQVESDSDEEFDGGLKVPGRIWSKLYKYQKTCVKWLWELHCQEAGGIIGDEMGLGKTIQAIAFLAALRLSRLGNKAFSHRGLGPCLVVCPATVMHQWVKEFHTWWPYFRVSILHSSGTFSGNEQNLIRQTVRQNGVLVTSYSTLVIQKDNILPYNWHYVVLDEGHKIRNPDAQATLVCKQFRTPHRVILSGSPIQNNLKELWSLMDFVFPGKLGTLPDFLEHFAVPIVQGGYSNATEIQVQAAYKCACVLRDTINPYLLRRMKADVKMTVNLPGKNEQVLFCRLTQDQREVYQEYLASHECSAIMSGRFAVFAGLIQLRKICNHPDLATGGPRVFKRDMTGDDPTLEYGFWKRAGKMIVVEALLKLWKKQGHKVLLFTQSSQMLDILESFVQRLGFTYLRMDGTTGISSRQPLVQRFNTDKNCYIFLLTTRVGGLGVNLVGANRIIIYDPDWNPSTDMQARERAWRIGQKRQVTIYRLLTTGTIEEKIYHRQIFKQFLTNRVLKDPKQRRLFKTNDMYELFSLGYSDDKGETETAAIFAGTGSDVNVKLKEDNRFDRIRKEKEMEKGQRERQPSEDEEEAIEQETGANLNFDSDEIKRMRELAKSLSRKMEREKNAKKNSESKKKNSDSSSDSRDSAKKGVADSEGGSGDKSRGATLSNSDKLKQYKIKKKSQSSSDLNTASAVSSGSSGHVRQNTSLADTAKHKQFQKSRPESSVKVEQVSKRPREEEKDRHGHKKKKHKKHKDAKFEGERIPHLVKSRDYKGAKKEKTQEEDNDMMDNYVLKTLFKKTGIQGALKHDKIMDPGKADYVIVESEADKVAKEASLALKKSKSQCLPASAGVPTWTGSHGSVAKRPRFGQKKNTALSGMETDKPKVKKIVDDSSTSKSHHFDGSLAGSVQTNLETGSTVSSAISSTDLLNKMRVRNEVYTHSASADNDNDDDDDGSFLSDPTSIDLIKKMQEFILFECANIGMATTQELLDEFGPKLPPESSAKFRAMLRSICDFQKKDDIGIWKLKREYRS